MSCRRPRPGWYCTRAEGHPGPCAAHPEIPDEKTPIAPHPRPAPVVVPSGTSIRRPPPLPAPRTGTPAGGTLAPLGSPKPPALLTDAERTRMAIMSRVLRTCDALTLEDLRLVSAFALRLRPGADGDR